MTLTDNLSPAVRKVLEGTDRELTDMFQAFRWHYRFEPIFCNPGCGHEKGSVENKVGYVRRNFLSPIVVIDDYVAFNVELHRQLVKDMQRPHYEKQTSIAKLFEDDKAALLTLPTRPFEAAKLTTAWVNKYGEIKTELSDRRRDGTLTRFQKQLASLDLLIIDELGYIPFDRVASQLLFNVICVAYEHQSVIVTSNLEFGRWVEVFGDDRLTAALIDRLVHHAHILGFAGQSYRYRQALKA